jgi:hypothetical protein
MAMFLRIIAVIVALGGLGSLSNATMGVGVICFACFLAILSRLAQAADHHRELKETSEHGARTAVSKVRGGTPSRSSCDSSISAALAGAYLHPDGFILYAQQRTSSGVLVNAAPVVRLPPHAPAADLGTALRTVLASYKEGVPHPKNWSDATQRFLKATGYRSWRALQDPSRSCWIEASAGAFRITPLKNGGPRGDQKGFQPFGAEAVVAPGDATNEQLGRSLEAALAASQ